MTNSLDKLLKNVKTVEQFVNSVVRFPRFYLRTEEEKKMTKQSLREYYLLKKGHTI